MHVNVAEQRKAAREFQDKWSGRGYEKGDTHSFWLELLSSVIGMRDVTTRCRFEERTASHGFIDVVIADSKTIVEQKSAGVSLDKAELRQGRAVTPYQQAKAYADALPNSQRPDFIVVCNFTEFRIHNLDRQNPEKDYVSFRLDELDEQFHLLNFLIDPSYSRQEREKKISIRAGELIGKLHAALEKQYLDPDSGSSQHNLNVLCVRLVFCLFAEDAGLFAKDAFGHYLQQFTAAQMRKALLELFEVLNTPLDQRDPYLTEDLRAFPYVNGGLFREVAEIPNFTEELRDLLLNEVSEGTDWSSISPTIFGGVFESTLNPELRREGGMHYTSPENIQKVIDPLFLDALTEELEEILGAPGVTERSRKAKLRAYHEKLGRMQFLEPKTSDLIRPAVAP